MGQWLESMGQGELFTRLGILGIVIFLLLLCGCYSYWRRGARARIAERNTQNLPGIALFQPPTYEEALSRMRNRRREEDTATDGANKREDTGTLLESEEPTGEDTGDVFNDNDEPNTRNTRGDSVVKDDLKDDVSASKRDEGIEGTASADDSAVKSSTAVETVDECVKESNMCGQCQKEGCGGKCNVKGGGRRKRAVSWKVDD